MARCTNSLTHLIHKNCSTEGSRNITFPEFVPGFRADWVDLRKHNYKRSNAEFEDCVSKERPKIAGMCDAKMGRDSFASP